MAKQINLEYKGRKYILEFNRKIVSRMEREGVYISKAGEAPASDIPILFQAAFAMHQRVTTEMCDEIFEHITGKQKLIATLYEMAAETINTLLEDSPEDEGNATWEMA